VANGRYDVVSGDFFIKPVFFKKIFEAKQIKKSRDKRVATTDAISPLIE